MQNGRLTKSELTPIHHPKLQVFLAAASAAASWNTMRMFPWASTRSAQRRDKVLDRPTGGMAPALLTLEPALGRTKAALAGRDEGQGSASEPLR